MKAILFIMSLVALLPSILVGQEIDLRQLDSYLQQEMNSCQIPGLAVGIVRDGEMVYCKGFGKNVGDHTPITADSPFLLASLTKSFTALAISQLERQGKLRLTDKVTDHVPFFTLKDTEYADSITINHLLDHRSGIPGISSYRTNREGLSLEDKARRFKNIKGTDDFGHFRYANDNYALLGLIIEKASQESYQDYVQQQILGPLGMSNSFFSQEDAHEHGMAKGHQLYFGIPRPSNIKYHRANIANGGMLSSARDLCTYIQSHLAAQANDQPIISALSKNNDLFESTPEAIYRKGWFIREYEGHTLYEHRGQLADYHNFMGFFPELNLGLVVLINQNALFLNDRIGQLPDNIIPFLFDDSLPEPGPKLTTGYWLFIGLSIALVLFLVVNLIRVVRNHTMENLASKDLKKTRTSIWIGNFLIPIAMMIWMWYLANYWMTSLHLAQPDILCIIQVFFASSLLVGLLKMYQLRRTIPKEEG